MFAGAIILRVKPFKRRYMVTKKGNKKVIYVKNPDISSGFVPPPCSSNLNVHNICPYITYSSLLEGPKVKCCASRWNQLVLIVLFFCVASSAPELLELVLWQRTRVWRLLNLL